MKGVVLSINPEVSVVDITHSVLAHDILDGALTIGQAYNYFPPRTIHGGGVAPGVGRQRRPRLVAGAPALVANGWKFGIGVGNAEVKKVLPTFANGTAGEAFGGIGSSGYLEFSVNKGGAARPLGGGRA